jgi:hypothetical protein
MSSTYIKKKIDQDASFLYDRKEVVTAPLWTTDKENLLTICTSSNQPHHQKIYYRNVYSNKINTSSMDIEFSIAYGNILNSGSSTASFGLIDYTDELLKFGYYATGSTNANDITNGTIGWNQYTTIQDSTRIRLSRFTFFDPETFIFDNKNDIYYTLAQIKSGQTITLRDHENQENYQIWKITGTPVSVQDKYWDIPVEFVEQQISGSVRFEDISLQVSPTFTVESLESYTNYVQYRNLLSDYETINNFTSGSFVFRGLGNTDVGPYIWGSTNYLFNTSLSSPTRISIPNVKSYRLNIIKSLGIRSTEIEHNVGVQKIYFINSEGNLFRNYPNVELFDSSGNWKQVSVGSTHQLAIKEDGTLWSWGDNYYGELGLSFNSNQTFDSPTKVGNFDDWEYVFAGNQISFGLRDGGKLYAWGYNQSGLLGFNDNSNRSTPERIGTDTWKKITVSNVLERSSTEHTILGIKTDGQMYGWGSNNNFKISTDLDFSQIQKEPYLMDPMGDSSYPMWKDVSAGDGFIIAIMDSANTLYSWGANSNYSELGLSVGLYVNTVAEQVGTDDDWESIYCGFNYTIALKSSGDLYGWGANDYDQQGRGSGAFGVYTTPTKITNIIGWTNIAASQFMTFASIGELDNRRTSIKSEDIYVINIPRKNFRDKLNAGSWELSLSAVDYDVNRNPIADTTKITTLVDETVDLIGTSDEYPIYSPTNNTSIFYGIYSGSLQNGIHSSAKTQPYGLIYPYHGLIVLNGELLLASASIKTRRTEPTASGAFYTSSNADVLFTSISGAMSVGKPFTAKTVEVMSPTYCFLNIGNGEFNNTFNPSFYFDEDKLIVKDKLKNNSNPFTYITTIGLYNDEDDLLAVAKLSKPIKKSSDTEFVVKVKLDI